MEQPYPSWDDFLGALDLFIDPILCALFAGIVLGYLGIYVILKRMVFVSATISQFSGLGVGAAFYTHIHFSLEIPPVIGAILFSIAAMGLLLIEPQNRRITKESIVGLLFVFAGGATVMIGDRIAQEAHSIQAIIFGTGVQVWPMDVTLIGSIGLTIILINILLFQPLSFALFDPLQARIQKLPVILLSSFVYLSIALMVGLSAKAMGSLPVFGLTIMPAMAALFLSNNLKIAFFLAALLGGIIGVVGYQMAFFLLFPVGASQSMVASLVVILAWIIRSLRNQIVH